MYILANWIYWSVWVFDVLVWLFNAYFKVPAGPAPCAQEFSLLKIRNNNDMSLRMPQQKSEVTGGCSWRGWMFLVATWMGVYPDTWFQNIIWFYREWMSDVRSAEVGRYDVTLRRYPRFFISRWWFQIFFIFTTIWGNDLIWRAFFSDGLVQPPTRYGYGSKINDPKWDMIPKPVVPGKVPKIWAAALTREDRPSLKPRVCTSKIWWFWSKVAEEGKSLYFREI